MKYDLFFTEQAKRDIQAFKQSEPQAYKKLCELLLEIQEHPYSGTGHPKPLGRNRAGQWSRRITKKHRLVYTNLEGNLVISILSVSGYYDEK